MPSREGGPDCLEHLFGHYAYTRIAWRESELKVMNAGEPKCLVEYSLSSPGHQVNMEDRENFVMFGSIVFHYLWNERCAVVHAKKKKIFTNLLALSLADS